MLSAIDFIMIAHFEWIVSVRLDAFVMYGIIFRFSHHPT